MDIYFKLPQIGDLMLEHEFYSFGNDPILFVCKDRANSRYLCSCCHIGDEWVVGQVSEENLVDLIDDRVSIREVFEACNTLLFVSWDGERFSVDLECPEKAFPQKGALLELEEEKTGPFRETLERVAGQRKANQAMIAACQAILPHIGNYTQYIASISQALLLTAPALQETSKYLSTIDTTQIYKIANTVAQRIDQFSYSQLDNTFFESESIMTKVAKDSILGERLSDDNEIYRYAA